jgi:hypothetical protein
MSEYNYSDNSDPSAADSAESHEAQIQAKKVRRYGTTMTDSEGRLYSDSDYSTSFNAPTDLREVWTPPAQFATQAEQRFQQQQAARRQQIQMQQQPVKSYAVPSSPGQGQSQSQSQSQTHRTDNILNTQRCGLTPFLTIGRLQKLEEYGIQTALKQAKADLLSPTYQGLVARDILIDQDFIDGNNNTISRRDWRAPVSGNYTASLTDTTVYKTSTDVKSNLKVFVFWGVQVVNAAEGRLNAVTETASITWKNASNSALYDIWQLEGLDIHNTLYTQTPLIYSARESIRIDYFTKAAASGSFDNLQLLGKVIEPKGQTIKGVPGSATGFLSIP